MDGKSKTKSRLDLEPEQVVDGECRWDTTGEFKLKEELNKLVISVKHVGTFTKGKSNFRIREFWHIFTIFQIFSLISLSLRKGFKEFFFTMRNSAFFQYD